MKIFAKSLLFVVFFLFWIMAEVFILAVEALAFLCHYRTTFSIQNVEKILIPENRRNVNLVAWFADAAAVAVLLFIVSTLAG